MADPALNDRRTRLEQVPIAAVHADDRRFQYRQREDVGDLVRSIRAEGQQEPIAVCGRPPYLVMDGFRRVEALRRLGHTTVQALIHPDLAEEEAHTYAFVRNVVRRNLSPLETAHAIQLAKKRGKSRQAIAACLGLSEKQVTRYEALLEFSPTIQELLDEGTISMAHASVLARADVSNPEAWAKRVENEGWSVSRLRNELRVASGKAQPGRRRTYLRKDGNTLRIYDFTVSRTAPRAQRQRVVGLLREAIAFLEGRD